MGDSVVLHAKLMAAVFDSPLTLLRVLETGREEGPADPVDWDVRRREAQADLDRLIKTPEGHQGMNVDGHVMEGQAATQIFQWAASHAVDLTALSTHGEHGRSRLGLASTAHSLVELAPGSLLLVPANAAARPRRYGRILVPLDGSSRAESALLTATRLATAHQAELLLVHVVPAPQLTLTRPPSQEDLRLEDRIIDRNERAARAYLDQLRARLRAEGLAVRVVQERGGDPRTRLLALTAREQVDLVVLSAHGQTGPPQTACGSVAGYLLTHVPVPLLALRERTSIASRALSTVVRSPAGRPRRQVPAAS